eukprot:gnl/Trimastix_PCT/2132.p1 GENE.gnl/Trimastix_PCT/2132~~gnl/Trimastix_PCT/2132.p1  ORF type:complete len:591 (-),score=97.47 gnl/Trimastix_PCT/2132:76-1848(-)
MAQRSSNSSMGTTSHVHQIPGMSGYARHFGSKSEAEKVLACCMKLKQANEEGFPNVTGCFNLGYRFGKREYWCLKMDEIAAVSLRSPESPHKIHHLVTGLVPRLEALRRQGVVHGSICLKHVLTNGHGAERQYYLIGLAAIRPMGPGDELVDPRALGTMARELLRKIRETGSPQLQEVLLYLDTENPSLEHFTQLLARCPERERDAKGALTPAAAPPAAPSSTVTHSAAGMPAAPSSTVTHSSIVQQRTPRLADADPTTASCCTAAPRCGGHQASMSMPSSRPRLEEGPSGIVSPEVLQHYNNQSSMLRQLQHGLNVSQRASGRMHGLVLWNPCPQAHTEHRFVRSLMASEGIHIFPAQDDVPYCDFTREARQALLAQGIPYHFMHFIGHEHGFDELLGNARQDLQPLLADHAVLFFNTCSEIQNLHRYVGEVLRLIPQIQAVLYWADKKIQGRDACAFAQLFYEHWMRDGCAGSHTTERITDAYLHACRMLTQLPIHGVEMYEQDPEIQQMVLKLPLPAIYRRGVGKMGGVASELITPIEELRDICEYRACIRPPMIIDQTDPTNPIIPDVMHQSSQRRGFQQDDQGQG